MGYHRAGFEVVGIDINPQPNYPFGFYQADALDVLRDEYLWIAEGFDAIHASPPCQAYTNLKARNRHIDHPELIVPTRNLMALLNMPYVIENVPGSSLLNPVMLCGSMFDGLGVKRHRLFESNLPLSAPRKCDHQKGEPRYLVRNHGKEYLTRWCPVYGTGGKKAAEHWPEAMGIDWMTRQELAEAIPPAYTEHVGRQVMYHLLEFGGKVGETVDG